MTIVLRGRESLLQGEGSQVTKLERKMKVCVMQTANALLAVIHDRGQKGQKLERVYRVLYNKELYLLAYARLYPNDGAMTKGVTDETVDGMSTDKIDALIEEIRYERFKWTPVRRVYIPKSNGKTRPLGIPTWKDKLLQEVIRMVLNAYFEPQFSEYSHGFRPERGCHTALETVRKTWTGTKWFIEGDIAQYFDTIDHDVLIGILSKHIDDGRFLRLMRELLRAGYMEDWKFNRTYSGTPQGGVVSPILSNIYLNEFDQWVEKTLIPAYTQGKRRRTYLPYARVNNKLSYMREVGKTQGVKELIKERRQHPSVDPNDPKFRRLFYIRYADDFLCGLAGTKEEAEEIKRKIKEWMQDNLKLTLSDEKTLITHATTEAAKFLGYDIATQIVQDKLDVKGRRATNGNISLRVPARVIENKCVRYKRRGKIVHRAELIHESDYSIILKYQQEYRGIVQYYLLAPNVYWFGRLQRVMKISLLKTLANKYKSTSRKMLRKYEATVQTSDGKTLKCLEVKVPREGKDPLVARFGGIALERKENIALRDEMQVPWLLNSRTEILKRMLADECELCGSRQDIQVHHIRKLADLKKKGRSERPHWMEVMVAMKRKTLVVCQECHYNIHAGRPTRAKKSLESRIHGNM